MVIAGGSTADAGFKAGFSVADAGNVNGVVSGTTNVDDLLIGAPGAGSDGQAYLVYGGSNLAGLSTPTPTPTGTVRYIPLDNIGATGTGAVPGAIFVGTSGSGDSLTGNAVSSAGDYNSSGFAGILIGSPDFSSSSTVLNQGEVTMFYGATERDHRLSHGHDRPGRPPDEYHTGHPPRGQCRGSRPAPHSRWSASSTAARPTRSSSAPPGSIPVPAPPTCSPVRAASSGHSHWASRRHASSRPVRAIHAGCPHPDRHPHPLRGLGRGQAANDDQHGGHG